MEKISIKDFKAVSKFAIVEGVFKKVEKALEGKELEFYSLDKEAFDKLMKEKNIENDNNIDFLFKIIPILSNVDMTIDKKEFEKICKFPSLEFANFVDLLMEHIKEMFKTAITLNSMEIKNTGFLKENNIEIPEKIVEVVKSKEELIEELYLELETCKDRARTKEIMSEIAKLEVDVVE